MALLPLPGWVRAARESSQGPTGYKLLESRPAMWSMSAYKGQQAAVIATSTVAAGHSSSVMDVAGINLICNRRNASLVVCTSRTNEVGETCQYQHHPARTFAAVDPQRIRESAHGFPH